jgi:hypothetical protein
MVKRKPKSKAKTPGIRKTIDSLLKKVEALENQSFAQKLALDELENKLQTAEAHVKILQDNSFGYPVIVPSQWPATPPPAPTVPYPYQPHTCTAGLPDWAGSVYCTGCGSHMTGPSWTVTSTSDSTTLLLTDSASQSSSGVEDTQEFDISWDIKED